MNIPVFNATATNTTDPCEPVLVYDSVNGCPTLSADNLIRFLYQYKFLWGAMLIIVGIFMTFFGNALVNILFFVSAMVATTLFCLLLITVI